MRWPRLLFGPEVPQVRLDGTAAAIVVANVFYNVAVVVRLVGGLWAHLDPRTEEAARVLGASRWRAFREVTWPLLRPAVVSAASIVFLFTVTSFGVVLLLGGPGDTTLEVEIYRQTAILLDLPTAAALTILQMAGVTGAPAGQRPRAGAPGRPATPGPRGLGPPTAPAGPRAAAGERHPRGHGALHAHAPRRARGAGAGQPRGAMAWAPSTPCSARTRACACLRRPSRRSSTRSCSRPRRRCIAGGLGLLAAVVVGYRRGWLSRSIDALIMLPLGTSAVIVGFGFLVSLDTPPLDLRTSILLIPIAHSLIALPFVVRAVAPVIRSIDDRLREAAAVLGASPSRAWREVDAPILARAALVGAGFAFAVSLGEFGATLFIARPDSLTIPVAIYRLLGQPGAANFATAMALATVLMVLCATAVLLIERLRGRGPQPF